MKTKINKINGLPAKKRGPKKIKFTDKQWDELKKLCGLFCTLNECASFFDISHETIKRRIREKYNQTFTEFYEHHSVKGKISLRHAQFQAATKGNVTMLIWLGKQYLEQREKLEMNGTHEVTGFDFVVVNDENKIIDEVKNQS